jgi:fatty acid desaturase
MIMLPEKKSADKYNAIITAAVIALHIHVLFVLPLFLLPLSGLFALTAIPFMLIHSIQWGLIHEAIHKHLSSDSRHNEYGGRMLSVLMGVSFHILRFGHLMHHKLNRNWQSELVVKNSWKEKTGYYYNLLGGLYITEVFSSLLVAILPKKVFLYFANKKDLIDNPEVFPAGERFFYTKNNVKHARVDFALAVILYGSAFIAYAGYTWLLLLCIASRAVMISFIDNLYHYGTTQDKAGKNLYMPKWAANLMLNSNYHETHHLSPNVPWIDLPKEYERRGLSFAGKFMDHGLMQFKGPILTSAETAH